MCGQGQLSDIRGSALPSAAKSNRSHYQSKVMVCNQSACAVNCAEAVDRLLITTIINWILDIDMWCC